MSQALIRAVSGSAKNPSQKKWCMAWHTWIEYLLSGLKTSMSQFSSSMRIETLSGVSAAQMEME